MVRPSKREPPRRAQRRRGGIGGYVLLVIVLVLLSGGLYLGMRVYTMLGKVDRIFQTAVPVTETAGKPRPTPSPLEPMNILLLGVDRREADANTLSDVNIVVHVDPANRFASMLSIPRDTQVEVPGYGYRKINAAYSLGGPGLAMRTVEQFLDMRIDYYAEVDFQGFERIVDLVGGITVDVPTPLLDNEYPTPDYGYTRVYIPAGLQHMDGHTALQYARSRHADDDLGRNQRQQQVLLALRDRIMRLDTLTDLDRMDALLGQLGNSLKTDIPKDTLWSMLLLAPKIERDNIAAYAVDWTCLHTISGTTYLEPDMGCVQARVQEMQLDPVQQRLRKEGARIEVRNGTLDCGGCAARTAEYLRARGFDVVNVLQDPDAGTYTYTLLLDIGDDPFTLEKMTEIFHVRPDSVRRGVTGFSNADIVLILGDDFVMPQE